MRTLRFANDGGPLIALDARLAAHWHGNAADGPTEAIPAGSDYERACHARYPADLLKVDGGAGVVIGAQEGISTAWWEPLKSDEVCLVGCVFGEEATDSEMLEAFEEDTPGDNWQHLGAMTQESGSLLLIHAASEGTGVTIDPAKSYACIEDGVSVALPRGHYLLRYRVFALAGSGLYTVVRWKRSERAA